MPRCCRSMPGGCGKRYGLIGLRAGIQPAKPSSRRHLESDDADHGFALSLTGLDLLCSSAATTALLLLLGDGCVTERASSCLLWLRRHLAAGWALSRSACWSVRPELRSGISIGRDTISLHWHTGPHPGYPFRS